MVPTAVASKLLGACASILLHSTLDAVAQASPMSSSSSRLRRRLDGAVDAQAAAWGVIGVISALTPALVSDTLPGERPVTVYGLAASPSDTTPLATHSTGGGTGGAGPSVTLTVGVEYPQDVRVSAVNGVFYVHGPRLRRSVDPGVAIIVRGVDWGGNPFQFGAPGGSRALSTTLATGVVSMEILDRSGTAVLPLDTVINAGSGSGSGSGTGSGTGSGSGTGTGSGTGSGNGDDTGVTPVLSVFELGANSAVPDAVAVNGSGVVMLFQFRCAMFNVSSGTWSGAGIVLVGFDAGRGTAICATAEYGSYAGTIARMPLADSAEVGGAVNWYGACGEGGVESTRGAWLAPPVSVPTVPITAVFSIFGTLVSCSVVFILQQHSGRRRWVAVRN